MNSLILIPKKKKKFNRSSYFTFLIVDRREKPRYSDMERCDKINTGRIAVLMWGFHVGTVTYQTNALKPCRRIFVSLFLQTCVINMKPGLNLATRKVGFVLHVKGHLSWRGVLTYKNSRWDQQVPPRAAWRSSFRNFQGDRSFLPLGVYLPSSSRAERGIGHLIQCNLLSPSRDNTVMAAVLTQRKRRRPRLADERFDTKAEVMRPR